MRSWYPTLSLAITVGVGVLAGGWLALAKRRVEYYDLIVASSLRVPIFGAIIRNSPFIAGTTLGMVLSAIVTIIVPYRARQEYFVTVGGLLSVFTWVIVLSFGMGAYFTLLLRSQDFFQAKRLDNIGLRSAGKALILGISSRHTIVLILYQLIVGALTLYSQYKAILSEIKFGPADTPWIDRVGSLNQFNIYGALHYGLRGIVGYMAIGWVLTGLWVFWQLSANTVPTEPWRLYTVGHRVNSRVKELGMSIVSCVIVISTAALALGIALVLVARATPQNALLVFLESTWLPWVLVMTISTIVCIGIIHRLRDFLEIGREAIEKRETEKLDRFANFAEESLDTMPASVRLEAYNQYLDARRRIHESVEKIDVSPVSRGGGIGIGGAVLLQLLGAVAALLELLRTLAKQAP